MLRSAHRFVGTALGTAAVLALLAAVAALGLAHLAPGLFTTLDRGPYDAWLRLSPATPDPSLILITRDAETDARFGGGPIDHAVFARVIMGLKRAGAAVVGADLRLDASRAPGRGGAAGDAILIEATRSAGQVVYPLAVAPAPEAAAGRDPSASFLHPAWPVLPAARLAALLPVELTAAPLPALAHHPLSLGHALASADPDGTVRALPLYVRMGDRAVPAFAMALAAAFLQIEPSQVVLRSGAVILRDIEPPAGGRRTITIPTDGRARMLIREAGRGTDAFPSRTLFEVWGAIDRGDTETLREWVAGKLVVIVSHETASGGLPAAQDHDILRQIAALNTILTGTWPTSMPGGFTVVLTLGLAVLGAWSVLRVGGVMGLGIVGLLVGAHLTLTVFALHAQGLVLPVMMPLSALLLASGGAAFRAHATASRAVAALQAEMRRIERELVDVRDELVRRESRVEALEEDLDGAKAAVSRSSGRAQELLHTTERLTRELLDAKAQEARTRAVLATLEQELAGLRAATTEAGALGDAELERLRQECERLGILTRDPHVLGLFRDLKKGARSALPILILGEPGTGKELFARAAHQLSPRAAGPFVAVNMAALPPELVESELFGHRKGSFTGAAGDRKGYFEQADRGTIFLDEIGDLPLAHQGKLLRVLQERSFYRVGDTKPTAVDVRIVAATNKDLARGVAEGWFREDVYFRLTGVVLRLPPLRERPADLPLLAERLLRRAADALGRPEVALSNEALAALQARPWRGNVRELRQCLEQAVTLTEGRIITKADLRLGVPEGAGAGPAPPSPDAGSDDAVLACLRQYRFDMQATARALRCDRSTVTQRLKGLGFRAIVEAGGDVRRAADVLAGDPALTRTVELKLKEYRDHLLKTIQGFGTAQDAVAVCRKRFKNLPDRHFESVETLIRQHLDRTS
ncbi:sigma 54-interacting transcriptional regulator [Candidatus Nitrospira bockiana]